MPSRPPSQRTGVALALVLAALLACKKKEAVEEAPAPAPTAPASASAEDRKVHEDVKALVAKFAGFAKAAKGESDLFLFDVAAGKIVGRYAVSITNSDELTYQEGNAESTWNSIASFDLRDNV